MVFRNKGPKHGNSGGDDRRAEAIEKELKATKEALEKLEKKQQERNN